VPELRQSLFLFHHSACQPVVTLKFGTGRTIP
jgi:hypothetical protein